MCNLYPTDLHYLPKLFWPLPNHTAFCWDKHLCCSLPRNCEPDAPGGVGSTFQGHIHTLETRFITPQHAYWPFSPGATAAYHFAQWEQWSLNKLYVSATCQGPQWCEEGLAAWPSVTDTRESCKLPFWDEFLWKPLLSHHQRCGWTAPAGGRHHRESFPRPHATADFSKACARHGLHLT